MVPEIIAISAFLILPVLIILITGKSKLANRIGAILIAYGVGLLIGNIGLIGQPGEYLNHYLTAHANLGVRLADVELMHAKGLIPESDILAFKIRTIQDLFLTITIPLALPLMLFSLNIRAWFRMASATFLSMIFALFAVLFIVILNLFIFRDKVDNLPQISGMLIGLYTGGTPNLAALKMMLNVDADTYIQVHTYDMVPSLVYLIFLISIGKVLFRKYWPAYPRQGNNLLYEHISYDENAYKGMLGRKRIKPLLFALLLAVLIFALAGSTTFFVNKDNQLLVVILVITTLSILASLIPWVNRIEKSFELGMYFILIFSIVVATMADLSRLLDISGALFTLISFTIFGSLFVHALLAKLFKIDADTLMVTSTALICSPPFVPMIAGSLRNKEIMVSGLTVGIIGYALGNYIGVLVSYLAKLFI